jgi:hypothetical protein
MYNVRKLVEDLVDMAALIYITNPYHLPHHYLIPIKTPITLWY